MNAKQKQQREAIERLREWVAPGDELHTVLRHRSASGMLRVIQVVKIEPARKGERTSILYLGYNVARALGWRYDDDKEGVRVSGAGMDMGFHLVYELAYAIFHERPGLDLKADPRLAAWKRKQAKNPHASTSPGYALDHRWL